MKILIMAIALSFSAIDFAEAHRGRTNSSGCHNVRATGGYHCHGGGSSSRSSYNSYRATSYNSSRYSAPKSYPSKMNVILEIQKYLNLLGYEAGLEDGMMGRKTRKAITWFQDNHSIVVDGKPSRSLLIKIKTKYKK